MLLQTCALRRILAKVVLVIMKCSRALTRWNGKQTTNPALSSRRSRSGSTTLSYPASQLCKVVMKVQTADLVMVQVDLAALLFLRIFVTSC